MDDTGKLAGPKNVANDLWEPEGSLEEKLTTCWDCLHGVRDRRIECAAEWCMSNTFPPSASDVFHFEAVIPPIDFEAPRSTSD